MHLTNYSVNKKSKKFQKNDDVEEAAGHKWSLKSLWPELDKLGSFLTMKILSNKFSYQGFYSNPDSFYR